MTHGPGERIVVFLFLLIALVVVVGAVTLAVVGGDEGGPLPEASPDRLDDPLPADRPLGPADVEALRLPMTVRGYRMADVDDVLDRLGAELAERDARIAELETTLAGARPAVSGRPDLLKRPDAPPLSDGGQGPAAPGGQDLGASGPGDGFGGGGSSADGLGGGSNADRFAGDGSSADRFRAGGLGTDDVLGTGGGPSTGGGPGTGGGPVGSRDAGAGPGAAL
jgi:DivIVA domain-containing protein